MTRVSAASFQRPKPMELARAFGLNVLPIYGLSEDLHARAIAGIAPGGMDYSI
jgi:hypothetical protein